MIRYFAPEDGPLYALLSHAKSEQADMGPGQRKVVVGVVAAVKDALKARSRR